MLKDEVVVIQSYYGNKTLSFRGWLKLEHNVDINNLTGEDHVKYQKLWITTPHFLGS